MAELILNVYLKGLPTLSNILLYITYLIYNIFNIDGSVFPQIIILRFDENGECVRDLNTSVNTKLFSHANASMHAEEM
jgi:hypothetical protein